MKLLKLSGKNNLSSRIILEKYLTINNSKLIFLFLVIGALAAYFFYYKEYELELLSKINRGRTKYFKSVLAGIYMPMVVGVALNFIIKSIIFFSVSGTLGKDISFLIIIKSFTYISLVSAFIGALNILGQIAIKNRVFSAIFPLVVINGLITIFSLGAFVIGESIRGLKNFLEIIFYPVIKLVDGCYFNYKFELMIFENQLVVGLLLCVLTALALVIAYRGALRLSKYDILFNYRIENIRKFIFLVLIFVIILAITITIGVMYSLIFNTVRVSEAMLGAEIITLILMPLVYLKLNKIYMKGRGELLPVAADLEVSSTKGLRDIRKEDVIAYFKGKFKNKEQEIIKERSIDNKVKKSKKKIKNK